MYFLPKANPLYEQLSADKVILPDILEKLAKGHFTGYLSHVAPGFESYCIFAKGKLICALSSEGGRDKTGFEAITLLFDKVVGVGGEINVYRMTADLAMCAQALVLGKKILQGDEVRQIDMKGLIARLKNDDLNGVVRFYTAERTAMMFYKNGMPFGFYHDRSRTVESTPDEARRVAALPGARVEVRSTRAIEELMLSDLLQMLNPQKLWEAACFRRARPAAKAASAPAAKEAPAPAVEKPAPSKGSKETAKPVTAPSAADQAKLTELVEDLKEVAMAYLSKEGRTLIEKRISEAGGSSILLDDQKTEALLKRLEDDARSIDSHARIEEMVDLMRSEIAGRLAV